MKPILIAMLVSQISAPEDIGLPLPETGATPDRVERFYAGPADADAGTGWNAPLYQDCPAAPKAERTNGGWFYPDLRKRRVDCLMETCRKHDELVSERLVTQPMALLPWWFLPTGTGLLGLGLGILFGYLISRAVRGSP